VRTSGPRSSGGLQTRAAAEAPSPASTSCPEETGDIPDTDEARLIILHPKATHKRNLSESTAMVFAQKATENRGTANRVNRNMLVYLAADDDRMAELDIAVRDYLGWSDVLAKQEDLDLTQNQKNQAIEKQRQAGETAAARLLGTYQWVLVPEGQPITITATKAEGQATSLAERVSKRLSSDGALSAEQAAAAIRHVLNTTAKPLWVPGHLTVGDLWRLYATYAYMPRLRDRSVLIAGLRNPPLLWEHDGFALADGYDADGKRYRARASVRRQFPDQHHGHDARGSQRRDPCASRIFAERQTSGHHRDRSNNGRRIRRKQDPHHLREC